MGGSTFDKETTITTTLPSVGLAFAGSSTLDEEQEASKVGYKRAKKKVYKTVTLVKNKAFEG